MTIYRHNRLSLKLFIVIAEAEGFEPPKPKGLLR